MKRKTLVPLLLLSLSLAIPYLAFSQNRTGSTRASSGAAVSSQADVLGQNISISLKGKVAHGTSIDLELTGCGATFRSQVTLGSMVVDGNQIPITGSIEYIVGKRADLYVLQYTIGLREPVPTSTTSGQGNAKTPVTNTSIGYAEKLITGTVKCAAGKGVDIFRAGDSILTLLVTE